MAVRNVIIDTDIGGDVDDALAIAFALNSPELDVKGITTVFVDVDRRTQLALELLEIFERTDIPVAKGNERPLMGIWDPSLTAYQASVVNSPKPLDCKIHAIDLIIDLVMGEKDITLVALGPLTNIALAIIKEPRIIERTSLVMMGGTITGARPEWNFLCDPEAARIVFESGIPITMVGLNVTERCLLDEKSINKLRLANTKRTGFLVKLIDLFMDHFNRYPVLHDPLAVASLVWPELMEFQDKIIKIETRGEFTRGVSVDCTDIYPVSDRRYNASVCVDVDENEFVKRFLERLLRN